MTNIYNLRNTELKPELAAKLWPFMNAYRPHDQIRDWRTLRAEGYEPIEEESLMEVIEDQFEAERELAN